MVERACVSVCACVCVWKWSHRYQDDRGDRARHQCRLGRWPQCYEFVMRYDQCREELVFPCPAIRHVQYLFDTQATLGTGRDTGSDGDGSLTLGATRPGGIHQVFPEQSWFHPAELNISRM